MILQFLVITLVVGFFASDIVQSTFASNTDTKPNVLINIDGHGDINQSGSLFEGLLYPSTIDDAENGVGGITGVIRINNQYSRIDVYNLGLGIKEEELIISNDYLRGTVYNSFLNNIRIKIEKGVLFSFNKTLTDYTSLRNLLYDPDSDNYNGYTIEEENRFSIGKGSTVDLKYTLHMVEETGDELEAVTANIPIYINVKEYINNDDDDDDDETITQPIVPIPSIGAHWAHDCIITLLNYQVIQGYPHENMSIQDYRNGTIDPVVYVYEAVQPEKHITRAEAAVLVGKALGLEEADELMSGYIDFIPSWAKGYIISTTRADVFEGYPFRLFRANKKITREEMIAVLARAYEITLENEGLELTFEDKEEIAEWSEEYVKAGYEDKVIEGYPDNTYKPKNSITRAETFTIICKLMGLHDEHTQGLSN